MQRYWDGFGWRAQRVWTGAQWVDAPLGPSPVVTQFAVPPKSRGHLGLWIGGGAVLAVIIVASVVVAAVTGDGSSPQNHAERHAPFCGDVRDATATFDRIETNFLESSLDDARLDIPTPFTPAQRAQLRAAASVAANLATRAPSDLKLPLSRIVRDYNAVLAGHLLSGDPQDETEDSNIELHGWWVDNCMSS